MAIGVVVAGFAIASALSAYALMQAKDGNSDDMGPKMDDYSPTMAQEGVSVPLIYGRVRVPGNIVWYGDLVSVEKNVESSGGGMMGGKAGGGGEETGSTTGYKFYANCWQVIGFGKLTLLGTYVNDKPDLVACSGQTFNNGSSGYYPTNVPYASPLKGIAHIYYTGLFLGEDTKQMPTIHFIVERVLETPLNYQNMANGSNPAAVIYDLLLHGGAAQSDINLESFQDAADYWNGEGYGINIVIDKQTDVVAIIEQLKGYVPFTLYIDSNGLFALKAKDKLESYKVAISETEITEFNLNRKSWSQTNNYYHATYISEADNYSERVVTALNPAAIRLAGAKKEQSLDLKCFRDVGTASKRLWDTMKKDSYPISEIKFNTNLKYSHLVPGDIVRISHSEYGIVQADFYIETVNNAEIDKNEVEFSCIQAIERIYDSSYVDSAQTFWEPPDTELVNYSYAEMFEMPYTTKYGNVPTYLALIERKKWFEDGFNLIVSPESSGGYTTVGSFESFSSRIKLETIYGASTNEIDDSTTGLEFSCPSGRLDISMSSIERSGLFSLPRIMILGSEIMAFQNIIPIATNRYRITGIVRGSFGTVKASHAINDLGWITYIHDNIISLSLSDFYVKYILKYKAKELSAAVATAIHTTYIAKARQPYTVGRIVATRSGGSVVIQLFPCSPGVPGSGTDNEAITDIDPPFAFNGDFLVSYGVIVDEIKTTTNFTIVDASAFTLTIKSRLDGFTSSGISLSIGSSDGEYIA